MLAGNSGHAHRGRESQEPQDREVARKCLQREREGPALRSGEPRSLSMPTAGEGLTHLLPSASEGRCH